MGRSVTLAGSRLRIVGVAPPGFEGLTGGARLWVPVGQSRPNLGSWAMERRDIAWLDVVARRSATVEPSTLEARLAVIGATVDAVDPGADDGGRVDAAFTPLSRVWLSDTTRALIWTAMAAALAILAIVVTNLAALLLARERRRLSTTALQLALGAGRGRITRQRVVEVTFLTLVGGGLGGAVAWFGVDLLRALWPAHAFRGSAGYLRLVDATSFQLDHGVLLGGLGAAVLTGLVASILPARLTARRDPAPDLRRGGRGAAGVGATRSRDWLIGIQVAFSTVLLVGSGLLAGTVWALRAQQRGFDADRLLVVDYSLVGRPSMQAPAAFHQELRQELRAIPGVTDISIASSPPLNGGFILTWLDQVEGREAPAQGDRSPMGVHVVDHAYLRTLGARLERGRTFTEAEDLQAGRVALINRTAARVFFGDADPLGRRIRFQMNSADPSTWWTVVGVVEDILFQDPTEGMRPEVFVPLGFWAPIGLSALLRTAGPPGDLVPAARRALAAVDPEMAYQTVRTGREYRAQDVASERALAVVLGLFTALALFLSAAGLWATVAQAVAEQRREIGVRIALGAEGRWVRRRMVARRLLPVLAGASAGLLAAAAGSGRLEGTLFGVGSRDPRVFTAAAGALLLVALLAAWLPARAATRVDPAEALRSE